MASFRSVMKLLGVFLCLCGCSARIGVEIEGGFQIALDRARVLEMVPPKSTPILTLVMTDAKADDSRSKIELKFDVDIGSQGQPGTERSHFEFVTSPTSDLGLLQKTVRLVELSVNQMVSILGGEKRLINWCQKNKNRWSMGKPCRITKVYSKEDKVENFSRMYTWLQEEGDKNADVLTLQEKPHPELETAWFGLSACNCWIEFQEAGKLMMFEPQMTAAWSLTRIPVLFQVLGSQKTPFCEKACTNLNLAAENAETAMNAMADIEGLATLQNSMNIQGFLCLVFYYLRSGSEQFLDNAKSLGTAFLVRSVFQHNFAVVPEDERQIIRAYGAENFAQFIVKYALELKGSEDDIATKTNEQIFSKGLKVEVKEVPGRCSQYYEMIIPGNANHLSRMQWIKGFLDEEDPVDLLRETRIKAEKCEDSDHVVSFHSSFAAMLAADQITEADNIGGPEGPQGIIAEMRKMQLILPSQFQLWVQKSWEFVEEINSGTKTAEELIAEYQLDANTLFQKTSLIEQAPATKIHHLKRRRAHHHHHH